MYGVVPHGEYPWIWFECEVSIKSIISPSPLSVIMQVIEREGGSVKARRVPIYVTPEVRDRIGILQKGKQTYGC